MKIPYLRPLFVSFPPFLLPFLHYPSPTTSSLINATHVYVQAQSHIHKPLSPLSAVCKHLCLEMATGSRITQMGTFTPWRKLILHSQQSLTVWNSSCKVRHSWEVPSLCWPSAGILIMQVLYWQTYFGKFMRSTSKGLYKMNLVGGLTLSPTFQS